MLIKLPEILYSNTAEFLFLFLPELVVVDVVVLDVVVDSSR